MTSMGLLEQKKKNKKAERERERERETGCKAQPKATYIQNACVRSAAQSCQTLCGPKAFPALLSMEFSRQKYTNKIV